MTIDDAPGSRQRQQTGDSGVQRILALLQRYPDDPDVLRTASSVFLEACEYSAASACYCRMQQLKPCDDPLGMEILRACAENDKHREGALVGEALLSRHTDDDLTARLHLVRCYRGLGDVPKAIGVLEEAVDSYRLPDRNGIWPRRLQHGIGYAVAVDELRECYELIGAHGKARALKASSTLKVPAAIIGSLF